MIDLNRKFPQALFALLLLVVSADLFALPCLAPSEVTGAVRPRPLEQRVLPAPSAVTALALQRNLGNGVAIRPRPARADHPLVPALGRMLASLPPALHRLATDTVQAIYLVQGNFGSARVEAARAADGRLVGGCMLLNLDALARGANDWASWREGSAFRDQGDIRIQLTLEPEPTDTVENALRFVFIHELGHIVGMVADVHGFWAAPETWPVTSGSPFTRISWNVDGGVFGSHWKQRMPLLALPRFYRFGAAPLPRAAAPWVYRALAETDWPSLYGSIDPYEDFAESFAIYLHRELLDRPYRLDLFSGPRHIGVFASCLDTGRCPGKRAFIERLLVGLSVL